MARLLHWPIGLGRVSYERLSGPRTQGSAATESLGGFVQTVSSVFGSWRYRLGLQAMQGGKSRKYRQMVTALHGGANAVRVPFKDPDVMTFAEAGVTDIPDNVTHPEVDWSNGLPWDNGQSWQLSRPAVKVAASAAKGDTIIHLANEYWGHTIDAGWIGFFPFHFGKYEITEVIEEGRYRVWPPLRKAIDTDTYASLDPVMVMRLENESGGTVGRGVSASEGMTLTMVEVEDQDVRDYFSE